MKRKYIIVKYKDRVSLIIGDSDRHSDIARNYPQSSILGGGSWNILNDGTSLVLFGTSKDYGSYRGPIPLEVKTYESDWILKEIRTINYI